MYKDTPIDKLIQYCDELAVETENQELGNLCADAYLEYAELMKEDTCAENTMQSQSVK